ncbi:MAG TPA: TasA family protein [Anaerolineae bacterium]|nr:TasA family protein [Anaerolineae bacterium]HOR01221.1 TasA family protein [Anaerolineae bacterium]HOR01224.1 TasA family protein [Anaerolineae bacterium]HPL27558.1 TasA family protein [Anaerolineae bacterium]
MMKRILMSLLTVCAVAALLGLLGGGTLASFSDSETSAGNTFTAGTLVLEVNGSASASGLSFTLPPAPLLPGKSGQGDIVLRNAGSIDGTLGIAVANLTDIEGTPGDPAPGELSGVLLVSMEYSRDGGAAWTPLASSDGLLSTWNGQTFGPLSLGAGEGLTLRLHWQMPADAAEAAPAMDDTATFDMTFKLDQA